MRAWPNQQLYAALNADHQGQFTFPGAPSQSYSLMEQQQNAHAAHQHSKHTTMMHKKPIKVREVILHCQFNQDSTCLAVSTNLGFKIFSLSHPENIVKLYETTEIGIVSLIEMQFRSNIIALVLSKGKKVETRQANVMTRQSINSKY